MNNNFKQQQQSTLISNEKNVLLSNVPLNESILAISTSKNPRKYIQQDQVQKLAENKGCNGLTYSDIIIEFMCNQKQAQRTIKHFHRKGILFTNQDLIKEGINGLNLKNTSPQRYYATIIKAKVIEKFKEKYENALVKPTMDNYKYRSSFPSTSKQQYNDPIQLQRARYLLELLHLLELQPPHFHKLQLLTQLPKEYYKEIQQTPCKGNSGKQIEEHVGPSL